MKMVMIQPIAINSSSAFVVVACAPEFESVVDVVVTMFPDVPFTCVFFDVCRDRTKAMITQIKVTFD